MHKAQQTPDTRVIQQSPKSGIQKNIPLKFQKKQITKIEKIDPVLSIEETHLIKKYQFQISLVV